MNELEKFSWIKSAPNVGCAISGAAVPRRRQRKVGARKDRRLCWYSFTKPPRKPKAFGLPDGGEPFHDWSSRSYPGPGTVGKMEDAAGKSGE